MTRLSWKRQESETGLARVCQAKRGYDLRRGGERLGYVRPHLGGWYWVATVSGRSFNSLWADPKPVTLDEAKADCKALVKEWEGR